MPASCDPSQDQNEILALRSPRSGGGSASEVQAQRIPVPFVGLDVGRNVAARSVAGRGIGQGRLFGSPASRVVSAARLPLLTVDAGDCRGEVPGHEFVDARRGVHVDDPAQGGGRLVALPMRRLPFSLHEVPKRRNLARRCGGLYSLRVRAARVAFPPRLPDGHRGNRAERNTPRAPLRVLQHDPALPSCGPHPHPEPGHAPVPDGVLPVSGPQARLACGKWTLLPPSRSETAHAVPSVASIAARG